MNFPLVSRERLEEAKAEISRLRIELETTRESHQKLWNFVVWLRGGVAFDTGLLPEAYQPKAGIQPATQCATDGEDGLKKTIQNSRGPGQARKTIANFEVAQEKEFSRLTPRVSKEQIKLIDELNKAADEGQRMAGD